MRCRHMPGSRCQILQLIRANISTSWAKPLAPATDGSAFFNVAHPTSSAIDHESGRRHHATGSHRSRRALTAMFHWHSPLMRTYPPAIPPTARNGSDCNETSRLMSLNSQRLQVDHCVGHGCQLRRLRDEELAL